MESNWYLWRLENGCFILAYLDNSETEVFQHCYLCFSILAIFRKKRWVKVGPKLLTLGSFLFHESSNPSKTFQTGFLLAKVLPLVRILAKLDHIGGVRVQKSPKKSYFVDTELVRKTLEIFNLMTANTILMKLTTIMYPHESVNWKVLRARNSFFWLNLITSLVKLLNKLDDVWGSIPWKITQNRFSKIATLTSLKLEPKLLSSRVM